VNIEPVVRRHVVRVVFMLTLVLGISAVVVGALVGPDWLLAVGLAVAGVVNVLLAKLMLESRDVHTRVTGLGRSVATVRRRQRTTAKRLGETERALEDVRAEVRSLAPTRRHVLPVGDEPRELGLHDVLSGLPDARSERAT
jgi:hypothetical protein